MENTAFCFHVFLFFSPGARFFFFFSFLFRWLWRLDMPISTQLGTHAQEKPYVMVKDDLNLTGNARYEGFCIDLLKRISGQVGFQYSIRLVPDHMYGVYDPETKTWNGIVRELMDRVSFNWPLCYIYMFTYRCVAQNWLELLFHID